jgi:hypothetical protein
MAKHEHSVELAGVNLAGRNHVCAFFNTISEEQTEAGVADPSWCTHSCLPTKHACGQAC